MPNLCDQMSQPPGKAWENKLWKRTRIALDYLFFLAYGVKLPTLILPLMSNLCSLENWSAFVNQAPGVFIDLFMHDSKNTVLF